MTPLTNSDKICFSKNFLIIAFGVVILLGFVLFSQSITNTKTATKAKAADKTPIVTGAPKEMKKTRTKPPLVSPRVSPVVICPAPDEINPYGIASMIFIRKYGSNGLFIEVNTELSPGTDSTRPDPFDGRLTPGQDQVRTGLDGIYASYARSANIVVYVDLGACIVKKADLELLQDFFKGINPNDINPTPDQIGHSGDSIKFIPATTN